ncbi:MAG: radical SAM family heme chaperone HemW [Fretibacterium sp.]|nr:radical SAM family heme chaperone HemW [Fretibacterium sp.]
MPTILGSLAAFRHGPQANFCAAGKIHGMGVQAINPEVFGFPLSLYIHVPFCAAKCGYCSFYSRPPRGPLEAVSWLDALEVEAGLWRERAGRRIPLRTLYVGGGTPSLLPVPLWRRLLAVVERNFDLTPLIEASAEANPSSLTEELMRLWEDSCLTRVSLGVQSLNDAELRTLGRLHDADRALWAMGRAARSRLALSADLIFGVPGQTLRSWSASLRGALAVGASHLSTYQLTLEPDTPLGRSAPVLPDGYPFYRYAQWLLPRKGFPQYEISSFAPEGRECRHNLAYWRQENVLALGPAAWGYLEGRRYENPRTLEAYLSAAAKNFPEPLAAGETLSPRQRAVEAAILALRTRWGIRREDFAARRGAAFLAEVEGVMSRLPSRLVRDGGGRLALTPAGMRVGNAVWTELMELL